MNFQRIAIASVLVAATVSAAIALSLPRPPTEPTQPTEIAVFSGGCFWGLQAAFDEVDGVVSSRVGYTGGDIPDPTYTKVVIGKTGHAEAVEVTFDPAIVSFEELLQIHIDRIKPKSEEVGEDYEIHHSRAAVFAKNLDQRETTLAAISQGTLLSKYILVEDASQFWEAEAEHQDYLANCVY